MRSPPFTPPLRLHKAKPFSQSYQLLQDLFSIASSKYYGIWSKIYRRASLKLRNLIGWQCLEEFDDPALHADELWETTLNSVLKLMLGWGTEGNMDEIIHHGRWGLDGLVKFAAYFVEEHGMSKGLFEGKLLNLVMVLKQR